MQKEEKFILTGIVKEVMRGNKFIVTLENGHDVTCTISGRIRIAQIKILKGDKVDVEVSVYDVHKGRIVWRHR